MGAAKVVVSGTSVVVEGQAVHIPPPPEDARMAHAGVGEVRARAQASLAFLDRELERSYQEQHQALAAFKKEAHQAGDTLGGPLHEAFWSLVRDPALKQGERTLAQTIADQMVLQRQRAERREAMVDMAARMEKRGNADEQLNLYDRELEERKRTAPIRAALAWEGDAFLAGYIPAWDAYAPRLEAYLQKSVQLISEVEALPQSEATKLLSRLLRLQVYERCRTLIALSLEIWTLAAAKVVEPRMYAAPAITGRIFRTGDGRQNLLMPFEF